MRIAIAGGTGFIGTALATSLRDRGDEMLILSRTAAGAHYRWDPRKALPANPAFEDLDVVVNLMGEPIATRPWTRARREILRDSRIASTTSLLAGLGGLRRPPKAMIGITGLWRFGDQGDTPLTEDSRQVGPGFLATLAQDWEAVHFQGSALGMRVAVLRVGLVLGAEGGVVPLLMKPFLAGLGGWPGDGTAYSPWVSLRDTTRALLWLVDHPDQSGSFHVTSPSVCDQRTFFSTFGEALQRRAAISAPSWVLRGAFGCMAEELLLASARALPDRLTRAGFTFEDPEIAALWPKLVAEWRARIPD